MSIKTTRTVGRTWAIQQLLDAIPTATNGALGDMPDVLADAECHSSCDRFDNFIVRRDGAVEVPECQS